VKHIKALKRIQSLTDFDNDIGLANLSHTKAGELLLEINEIATEALKMREEK